VRSFWGFEPVAPGYRRAVVIPCNAGCAVDKCVESSDEKSFLTVDSSSLFLLTLAVPVGIGRAPGAEFQRRKVDGIAGQRSDGPEESSSAAMPRPWAMWFETQMVVGFQWPRASLGNLGVLYRDP